MLMENEQLNRLATIKLLKTKAHILDEWIDMGMPFEPGPHGPQSDRFDIGAILQWHIDNGAKGSVDEISMSATEAKRRQAVAVALSAELDLAQKRGQLAKIEDLMSEFSRALIETRAALMSQSNRLTGLLSHQDDETVMKILNDDAAEILSKLSQYQHEVPN